MSASAASHCDCGVGDADGLQHASWCAAVNEQKRRLKPFIQPDNNPKSDAGRCDCGVEERHGAAGIHSSWCPASVGFSSRLNRFARPDNNPKSAYGVEKPALHLCPPAAMVEWAGAMSLGATKYGPYNWRKEPVAASVYISAMLRHVQSYLDGETRDSESRAHPLGHVMACCSIILDAAANGKLIDDRPSSGAMADLCARWKNRFVDDGAAAGDGIRKEVLDRGVDDRTEVLERKIDDDTMRFADECPFKVGDRVMNSIWERKGTVYNVRNWPTAIGVRWDGLRHYGVEQPDSPVHPDDLINLSEALNSKA